MASRVSENEERIPVAAGGRRGDYEIRIRPGVLDEVGAWAASLGLPGRVGIVTDRHVGPLYAERLRKSLEGAGFRSAVLEVPPGETSKDLDRARFLWEALTDLEFDRASWLLALGGGVVGDLAGFVASTFLRGIPIGMVPTTILAQVDSSVGGKTGINFGGLKNRVGTFHPPRFVAVDPSLLVSLADRDFRAGLAEAVKCGMIRDASLLGEIEAGTGALLAKERAILLRVLGGALRVKAALVSRDEREAGERALLNYGHTLGHAIEEIGEGEGLLHGEAVSIGMNAAALVSVELGLLPAAARERQNRVLRALGLPLRATGLEPGQVIRKLLKDKKFHGGEARLVLTTGVGSAIVRDHVPLELVERAVVEGVAT
jgi:3-dehydroquinate synthase